MARFIALRPMTLFGLSALMIFYAHLNFYEDKQRAFNTLYRLLDISYNSNGSEPFLTIFRDKVCRSTCSGSRANHGRRSSAESTLKLNFLLRCRVTASKVISSSTGRGQPSNLQVLARLHGRILEHRDAFAAHRLVSSQVSHSTPCLWILDFDWFISARRYWAHIPVSRLVVFLASSSLLSLCFWQVVSAIHHV